MDKGPLAHQELAEALEVNPPLVSDGDGQPVSEEIVQAASIDLHVGKVYHRGSVVLEADRTRQLSGFLDSICKATGRDRTYSVPPGQMVIVETKERLTMPDDLVGLVTEPNYLVGRGLLLLMSGHVDPGYTGTLTVRLVNLRRNEYSLKVGEHILTSLFFRATESDEPYTKYRSPEQRERDLIDESNESLVKLLLLPDEYVSKDEFRHEVRSEVISILIPVLAVLAAVFVGALQVFPSLTRLLGGG